MDLTIPRSDLMVIVDKAIRDSEDFLLLSDEPRIRAAAANATGVDFNDTAMKHGCPVWQAFGSAWCRGSERHNLHYFMMVFDAHMGDYFGVPVEFGSGGYSVTVIDEHEKLIEQSEEYAEFATA